MSTQPHSTTSKTVTVVQGDYFVSADPDVIISTVLGSCVSVCLYDPVAGVGGMNHFLLATQCDTNSTDLKYGVNALELLINRVLQAGAKRERLQAKLFGGARITDHSRDIGNSNADFAIQFLEREGIACVSQSLRGEKARRVRFHPTTGAAKLLQIANTPQIEEPVKPQDELATDIILF